MFGQFLDRYLTNFSDIGRTRTDIFSETGTTPKIVQKNDPKIVQSRDVSDSQDRGLKDEVSTAVNGKVVLGHMHYATFRPFDAERFTSHSTKFFDRRVGQCS